MAGLTALMMVLATVDLAHLANWFWPLLILMVALSATQDIAIDAYTIEVTTHRELGVANSVRNASDVDFSYASLTFDSETDLLP